MTLTHQLQLHIYSNYQMVNQVNDGKETLSDIDLEFVKEPVLCFLLYEFRLKK